MEVMGQILIDANSGRQFPFLITPLRYRLFNLPSHANRMTELFRTAVIAPPLIVVIMLAPEQQAGDG